MEQRSEEKKFYKLYCSHGFCENCVKEHIAKLISQEKPHIKCPSDSCEAYMVKGEILDILGNTENEDKVLKDINAIYCERMPDFPYFCPASVRGNAV